MRIMFTIDSLLQGGTEQSILNLIQNFSNDIDVSICYFYPNHDLRERFIDSKVDVYFLSLNGSHEYICGSILLKRIFNEWKPDVVVCSLYRASIISRIAVLGTGIPIVGTLVTDSYSLMRKSTFKGLNKIKFFFTYLLDFVSSGITNLWISNSYAISESSKKALSISPDRIKVIYRGRSSERFEKSIFSRNDTSFIFSTIGRLFDYKGYKEILSAFKLISLYNPNVYLHIYGEGPYREDIEHFLQSNGLSDSVKLFGNTPNAFEKLINSNCFILASWYEGFSGALVEAMMIGIPIISSDIPMNLEAVSHNVTARVFPVRDHTALAREMEWVMNNYDEAVEMGQRARMESMQRFDIKVIAKEYEEALRSVIEKRKR